MEQQLPQQTTPRLDGFRFEGEGSEFFRIWIVNILLTILTLGIYSAWAKVRTKRYFYGNTFFDGSNFEYHATPIQILKGRLIAFAVFVAVSVLNQFYPLAAVITTLLLVFIAPYVIWSALRFNAKMSSYRNVKFGFSGDLSALYRYFLIIPLIPVAAISIIVGAFYLSEASSDVYVIAITIGFLSVYLMVPYIQALFQRYYINGSRFGQGAFKADIAASFYYKTYLKVIGISLLGLLLLVVLVVILMAGLGAMSGASIPMQDPQSPFGLFALGPMLLMIYLPFIILGIFTKAYIEVRLRNYSFNQTSLDDSLLLQSDLKVMELFKIQIVNFLLLVCTLGLAYPWVAVRLAKYSAESTQAEIQTELSHYVTQQQNQQSALAEEMGETFDLEADVGLTL